MDTIKILKSILSGNATGSKRIDDIQRRGSGGGGGGGGGGLADILGSVLGGAPGRGGGGEPRTRRPESSNPKDVGGMLEDLLGVGGGRGRPPQAAPEPAPAPRRESRRQSETDCDQAVILIRAMCNAAKVDGNIDQAEQDAIVGRLGDVTREEIDFVRRELGSPLDLDGYCRSVPRQLTQQAYAFSVMAIKLDSLSEAAYLGRLGAGLDLDPSICNRIHQQIGAPCLYA